MPKLLRSLLATALLQIGFFVFYFAIQSVGYRHYFGYLAISLLLLTIAVALLMALTGPWFIKKIVTDSYERRLVSVMAAIIFIGFTNFYNIIFPVSLERSFTVRILINLAQANGSLSKDELEKHQSKEAIYGIRYNEMLGSGLIRVDDQKITLTEKGQLVAHMYLGLASVMGYSEGFKCAAMEKCD